MTTISSTTARSAVPGVLGGFVRWLATWANNVAAYWARREAIKTLRAMDDHELYDIGIRRCQIEAAVKGFVNPDIDRLQ